MTYLFLKYFHVLGAIVILGTGTGIAFFMLMAHRSGDVGFLARTAGVVVQPLTGYLLVRETGQSFSDFWISAALVLYVAAGIFWLPVMPAHV